MLPTGLDPELINDFLTESGELIEQLDADLVSLESEPEPGPLLDQIFRALHTIKGSASFLNLGALTEFAHAAEDALNCLRKGQASVNETVVDALLRSVDVLRRQLGEVADGADISPGPTELVELLHAIAAGGEAEVGEGGDDASTPASTGPDDADAGGRAVAVRFGGSATPLDLPEQKVDVLPFMVTDLQESADQVADASARFRDASTRDDARGKLGELAESLRSTAEFFELTPLERMIAFIGACAEHESALEEAHAAEVGARLAAIALLLGEAAKALGESAAASWDTETLLTRGTAALRGEPDADAPAAELNPEDVLLLDGVSDGADVQPGAAAAESSGQPRSEERRVGRECRSRVSAYDWG